MCCVNATRCQRARERNAKVTEFLKLLEPMDDAIAKAALEALQGVRTKDDASQKAIFIKAWTPFHLNAGEFETALQAERNTSFESGSEGGIWL